MENHKILSYLFFLLLPVFSFGQKIDSAEMETGRIRRNNRDSTHEFNEGPNTLLIETVKGLMPGKALDLGMGLGRNSIYLAMNGWDVTGVDIAQEAVVPGLMEASKKVSIDAIVNPLETGDFGINEWDLIVHVYKGCLDDSRISKIEKALKPRGVLVFEFFHHEAGIEMKRPTLGCETNAIKRVFEKVDGFNLLSYSEEVGIADDGLKNYKLIKLVAAKK